MAQRGPEFRHPIGSDRFLAHAVPASVIAQGRVTVAATTCTGPSHVTVLQLHIHALSNRGAANKPLELQGERCAQPHSNDFSSLAVTVKADAAAGSVVIVVALHML
jgi:hypothetical protein